MIALLASVAAVQMTFICTPIDEQRRSFPYVVSFERSSDLLRRIWVIWPNGSQSSDRWKGRIVEGKFVVRSQKDTVTKELTLSSSPTKAGQGTLNYYFAVTGGHIPMQQTDEANCFVRAAETARNAGQ